MAVDPRTVGWHEHQVPVHECLYMSIVFFCKFYFTIAVHHYLPLSNTRAIKYSILGMRGRGVEGLTFHGASTMQEVHFLPLKFPAGGYLTFLVACTPLNPFPLATQLTPICAWLHITSSFQLHLILIFTYI